MAFNKLMATAFTGIFALGSILAGTVRADSTTPLALKMDVMAAALKHISKPGSPGAAANPLDDLKLLKDATIDCRDHADDLAPAAIAHDPQALAGFKAEFVTLLDKVTALETALNLPPETADRDAQIKAALDGITAVKKDGHAKYNNG